MQTTDTESTEFANSMAAIRSKVEKLNQSREQGTLHHHQCIDELTSHLRNTQLKNVNDSKIASPTRSETPTSFVTVIEVKDPSPIQTSIATSPTSTSISIAANDSADSKPEPTTPAPTLPTQQQQRSSPLQQHQQQSEESKEETQATVAEKNEENNASPVQNVEIRRKIPPRYGRYYHLHLLSFIQIFICLFYKLHIEFDSDVLQATAKGSTSCWPRARYTNHNH